MKRGVLSRGLASIFVLSFLCASVAPSFAAGAASVELNKATAEQLAATGAVDKGIADKIVQLREELGRVWDRRNFGFRRCLLVCFCGYRRFSPAVFVFIPCAVPRDGRSDGVSAYAGSILPKAFFAIECGSVGRRSRRCGSPGVRARDGIS